MKHLEIPSLPLPSTVEDDWSGPIICPSEAMTAWLLTLVTADIAHWEGSQRSGIELEQALSFSMYLADHLSAEARADAGWTRSTRKAG